MLDRLARWLSQSENLILASALGATGFLIVFWAITDRFEPAFVALIGSLLTTYGLMMGRKEPPKPLPAEPTSPPLTEDV